MSNSPYWSRSKQKMWVCPNHLPSAKMPMQVERCWFRKCNGTRPEQESLCFWWGCNKNNGNKANRRQKSKYCSTYCKNKNARWRFKLRKLEKAY